ncbi:MAG: hypothetical protein SFU91_03740 [Chloroherpetonaceae bacterium]|nr:hypothetical protein [Chloroherpetonaceae bacterium]
MNIILKNALVFILAFVLGSIANMALILLGGVLIPSPAGGDTTTMEGLKAVMSQMGPQHFLFPFLAHAVGSLVGGFIVGKFGEKVTLYLAIGIGALFFAGGAFNVAVLPSPLWFTILDLAVAYFPMAYFGYFLSAKKPN